MLGINYISEVMFTTILTSHTVLAVPVVNNFKEISVRQEDVDAGNIEIEV